MENKQSLQVLANQPSKVPILSLSKDDLTHWLTQCQQPAHRFGQIYQWIFDKRATDFSMMSDLPLFLREELAKKFKIFSIEEAVQKIKLRSRKLVWLNPLKGMQGYEPIQRGMQAALPALSHFGSAHNFESLLQLENILTDA